MSAGGYNNRAADSREGSGTEESSTAHRRPFTSRKEFESQQYPSSEAYNDQAYRAPFPRKQFQEDPRQQYKGGSNPQAKPQYQAASRYPSKYDGPNQGWDRQTSDGRNDKPYDDQPAQERPGPNKRAAKKPQRDYNHD